MDLKNIRQEYQKQELTAQELLDNPFEQFKNWYSIAAKDKNAEPNAMTLSTVNTALEVSSRIVLLKEIADQKFRFFTNYKSQKGIEIEENPKVALLFFWSLSEKQVRIKGIARKGSTKVSDNYFYSRPSGSQAGAIASPQSSVLTSKDQLIQDFESIKTSTNLQRPAHWGAYEIEPYEFEFWQGGKNRLHDRFRYTKTDGLWEIVRLAP